MWQVTSRLFSEFARQIESSHLPEFCRRSGTGGESIFESDRLHGFHVLQQDDGNIVGRIGPKLRRTEHQDLRDAPQRGLAELGPLDRPLGTGLEQGGYGLTFAVKLNKLSS